MRISDWSSDVCSSDLLPGCDGGVRALIPRGDGRAVGEVVGVWHFSDLEDRGHWIPAVAGMTIKSSGRSRAQLLMRSLLVLLLSLCTLAAADAVAREPVRLLVFTKTDGTSTRLNSRQ